MKETEIINTLEILRSDIQTLSKRIYGIFDMVNIEPKYKEALESIKGPDVLVVDGPQLDPIPFFKRLTSNPDECHIEVLSDLLGMSVAIDILLKGLANTRSAANDQRIIVH